MRAFALSLFVYSVSKSVLACSVCGCDPSGGNLSLDRPTEAQVRVTVEDRFLAKESGAQGEDEHEGEKEDRLDFRVQYSPPVPRLSLQLDVPVYPWKAHYGSTGLQDDTNQGLADIMLTARYEFLHLEGFRHTFALLASLKAPTGSNDHLASVDEGEVDEHKQIGTGTWDEFLTLTYSFGDFPTVAYASVSARINGTNSRGNHYGNAVFGLAGVRHSFLESRSLYLSLDAQVRNAGYDTVPGGTYDPNSGGFVGYAVGSVGYAITMDLLVRAIVQVPVATSLNGVQDEHPVAFLAFSYDFDTR
jgi:hypothetical protein